MHIKMPDTPSSYWPLPIQRYLFRPKRVFNSTKIKCEFLLPFNTYTCRYKLSTQLQMNQFHRGFKFVSKNLIT